jgi:hypothetical protein
MGTSKKPLYIPFNANPLIPRNPHPIQVVAPEVELDWKPTSYKSKAIGDVAFLLECLYEARVDDSLFMSSIPLDRPLFATYMTSIDDKTTKPTVDYIWCIDVINPVQTVVSVFTRNKVELTYTDRYTLITLITRHLGLSKDCDHLVVQYP